MDNNIISRTSLVIPLYQYVLLTGKIWIQLVFLGFTRLIERIVGSPVLISIPHNTLQSLDSCSPSELSILEKLQSKGFIKQMVYTKKYPDEPKIHIYQTYNKGGGGDFFSKNKALWRAVGESIERSIWVDHDEPYRGKTNFTNYDKLSGRKLNIQKLPGFSSAQLRKYKILQFDTKTTSFEWVTAYSHTSKSKIWIPLQLVSGHYSRSHVPSREPMLRWSVSTGLATGRSLVEALSKGALEVIERDAFMITYLNKIPPPRVNLKDMAKNDPRFADMYESFKRYRLELTVFSLPTDFYTNVLCAAIVDRTGKGPALTLGAKADPDFYQAFWGAVQECHFIRYGMKDRFTKTYSAERMQLEDRQIYWAQLEHLGQLDFFFTGPEKTVAELEKKFPVDTMNPASIFKILTTECRDKGYSLIGFDLQNKTTNRLGFWTAQVLIPELQPLHLDESIPYLGGPRLQEVPAALGYTPLAALNTIPHPFP